MKSVVFACLLVLAGVSAFPQEVAPSQERMPDVWVTNAIEVLRRWIVARGYDPFVIDNRRIDYILIDGLVEVLGYVKGLRFEGASGIFLNSCNYNILLGRLDFDIAMPQLSLSLDEISGDVRYGSRGGWGLLSGSLVVSNIRLIGDVILRLDPGPQVTINNINLDFTVGSIEADFKAAWLCRGCLETEDVSEKVNSRLNVWVVEMLEIYKNEIETILGEIIRRLANKWW